MAVVLFSAHCVDWSLHAVDEASGDENRYTIYTDGTIESIMGRDTLSPEVFARLMELFAGDFCRAITHGDAYDGEGWSMTLYAGNGHIIHETGLGYIYGVPVLEEIATILRETHCHSRGTTDSKEADPLSPDVPLRNILQSMASEQKKKVKTADDWPELL